jgi:5-methylthioadenosine/S-adenosylhomocysteine deaminase
MTKASILIRDALIVPGNSAGSPAFQGWLRVEGNAIAGIGPGNPTDLRADLIFDGRQRVLLPGLVNAHAHSHSSLTRGSAEGLPLDSWLRTIETEQRRLTETEAYDAALATYSEMLLGGTTTVVDMCLFPRAALKAARKIGIRAVIAPYVADGKPFTPTLSVTESLLGEARSDDRIKVWVGLHDLESCSDAQVQAGAALTNRYGAGIHLHCAETEHAVNRTLHRTGRRPVAHLVRLGALGPRTLLAHCVWVDAEDRNTLARHGASVVHCPHANLKLGSGIAPIPELCDAGVNIALGTDGAKANNSLDMFEVMKLASLLHKGAQRKPAILPPAQVLAMGTENGTRALGIPAGTLVPGLRADLTLIRLDRFHLQPAVPDTILTNLIHSARASDVDFVMVDGVVVVEGGVIRTVDADAIRRRAGEIALGLLQGLR